jgi:phage baseplate assembly protein W
MNPITVPHLGVGWAFPIARGAAAHAADGERAGFACARYEESVRQAIWIILSTARGERVMRPDFGCALDELLFAPNDATTRGMAESAVREALLRWEPRIDVLRVAASADGPQRERLLIGVDYRVRKTDSRFNLVYPFYLGRPVR